MIGIGASLGAVVGSGVTSVVRRHSRGAVHPAVIAPGGYSMIALLPIIGVVMWVKILENSTDYSVQNTTRHALFLRTSRTARYKAKQATDSFFVRAGDMLQAAVVFVGTMLAFGIRGYALVNLALVVVWLLVAFAVAREHRRLAVGDVAGKAA